MAEKSEVIREVMRSQLFRDRVRAIVSIKAYDVLKHVTGDETMSPAPDANTIAWAKAAVVQGYDAWLEALMILTETQPATETAAHDATDTTYTSKLDTVLNEVVAALN